MTDDEAIATALAAIEAADVAVDPDLEMAMARIATLTAALREAVDALQGLREFGRSSYSYPPYYVVDEIIAKGRAALAQAADGST